MIVRTSSIVVDIVVPTIVVSIFLSVCRGKIRTIVVALCNSTYFFVYIVYISGHSTYSPSNSTSLHYTAM